MTEPQRQRLRRRETEYAASGWSVTKQLRYLRCSMAQLDRSNCTGERLPNACFDHTCLKLCLTVELAAMYVASVCHVELGDGLSIWHFNLEACACHVPRSPFMSMPE